MKPRQLKNLGVPEPLTKLAIKQIGPALEAGLGRHDLQPRLKRVIGAPDDHRDDPYFGELAAALARYQREQDADAIKGQSFTPRDQPAAYRQYGDDLDPGAVDQMRYACELPVAECGALMPDAHIGYGLPIGGVLATRDAVIPYAVGVDIACRMKLSVLDLPTKMLDAEDERLEKAIEQETRFGVGAAFVRGKGRGKTGPRDHPVMDEDWSITGPTQHVRDKAAAQLGSSGSGNHFVEFGLLHVEPDHTSSLGLPEAGTYLALLSHSGSRGAGASVASFYSNLAMRQHPELPKHLKHLAWLDLDSDAGREYWAAMNLMGRYAAASHERIHHHIAKNLDAEIVTQVENHHNFAWRETHRTPGGEAVELIVHRKGATPAGEGELGIIPGSMASPCYIVRGRGEADALRSAAHGAGRVMSRRKAKTNYRWSDVNRYLEARGVRLISAGLDEAPFVYKDIDEVMAAQRDLVDVIGRFDPKLVKMAPGGPAED